MTYLQRAYWQQQCHLLEIISRTVTGFWSSWLHRFLPWQRHQMAIFTCKWDAFRTARYEIWVKHVLWYFQPFVFFYWLWGHNSQLHYTCAFKLTKSPGLVAGSLISIDLLCFSPFSLATRVRGQENETLHCYRNYGNRRYLVLMRLYILKDQSSIITFITSTPASNHSRISKRP